MADVTLNITEAAAAQVAVEEGAPASVTVEEVASASVTVEEPEGATVVVEVPPAQSVTVEEVLSASVEVDLPPPVEAVQVAVPGLGDKNYVHIQDAPSTVWTIEHNLGKRPALLAIDTAGKRLFGNETYPDLDTAVITYSTPQAGSASAN